MATSTTPDPLDIASKLVAELRWLRERWLARQLDEASDPLRPTLVKAEALVALLEDDASTIGVPVEDWARWGVVLALTGDVAVASAAIGRRPGWGTEQLRRFPQVAEACTAGAGPPPSDWTEMHDEARHTVQAVMRLADPGTRLKAAELVVERIEGRVPQRVAVDPADSQDLLDTALYRYACALHLAAGWDLDNAIRHAEQNPDEVAAWAREVGFRPGARPALGAGEIVQEAEVVEGDDL